MAASSTSNQINVPASFPTDGPVYCFDAGQRGDMYHIRAWEVLANFLFNKGSETTTPLRCPLIMYGYSDDRQVKGAYDYIVELQAAGTPLFVCSWNYKDLVQNDNPLVDQHTKLNGQPVQQGDIVKRTIPGLMLGPSNCTEYISAHQNDFASMPAAMVHTTDANSSDEQREEVLRSIPSYFPRKDDKAPRQVALVLWRNTTASGGPYPELNTGFDSMVQIAKILRGLGMITALVDVDNAADRKKIKSLGDLVHCSDGPYYLSKSPVADKWPGHAKRDVEAYFIREAFLSKHFHMAVGLRSGALDLLTFLGVPTVSIGLDNMVGEFRMNKLAANKFQRINVEYICPRHCGTGWIKSRADSSSLLQSPIGAKDEQPQEAYPGKPWSPTKEKAEASERIPPEAFRDFDIRSVELGIRLAVNNFLFPRIPSQARFVKGGGSNNLRLIKAVNTRYFYLVSEATTKEALRTKLLEIKAAEKEIVDWCKGHAAKLRQPENVTAKMQQTFDTEWDVVQQKIEDEDGFPKR